MKPMVIIIWSSSRICLSKPGPTEQSGNGTDPSKDTHGSAQPRQLLTITLQTILDTPCDLRSQQGTPCPVNLTLEATQYLPGYKQGLKILLAVSFLDFA